MIDWCFFEVPFLHKPIESGRVLCINPDSSLAWSTPRRLNICGSHESNIAVRSTGGDGKGNATHLEISGNPSKFLQGHNLVGSNDLLSLNYDVFIKIITVLNLPPNEFELNLIKTGKYKVKNIHYNEMFELPTREDVRAWLRAGEFKAKSRHGRSTLKGTTLYLGYASKRWKLVFYCKADEINASKSHYLADDFRVPEIMQFIDNKLRAELRLFSRELSDLELNQAYKLTEEKLKSLFKKYIESIDMSGQIPLTSQQLHDLPNVLRSTYLLWKDGYDLRSELPKPTYYRHRKQLLDFNIDINIRCDRSEHANNVIPFVRILEAKPVAIPDFFFDRGFIHHSAMRA